MKRKYNYLICFLPTVLGWTGSPAFYYLQFFTLKLSLKLSFLINLNDTSINLAQTHCSLKMCQNAKTMFKKHTNLPSSQKSHKGKNTHAVCNTPSACLEAYSLLLFFSTTHARRCRLPPLSTAEKLQLPSRLRLWRLNITIQRKYFLYILPILVVWQRTTNQTRAFVIDIYRFVIRFFMSGRLSRGRLRLN
jgi:hypothetical protein